MPRLNALQNTALLLRIRGLGQSTVHSLPFRLAWVRQLAVKTPCTTSTNHRAQTLSQAPQGEAVLQQHLHPACCQGVQTTKQQQLRHPDQASMCSLSHLWHKLTKLQSLPPSHRGLRDCHSGTYWGISPRTSKNLV